MCSCSLGISAVTGPAHCLQFISSRLSQDIPGWAAGSPWNSMNINDTANLLQYNGKPDALILNTDLPYNFGQEGFLYLEFLNAFAL